MARDRRAPVGICRASRELSCTTCARGPARLAAQSKHRSGNDVGLTTTQPWSIRMVDPGDWLPLMGVMMLAGTTVMSIAGAYALGRSRRREIPPPKDVAEQERLERLEHLLEVMAVEVERIGEGQRFLVKVMAEKQ